MVSLAVEKNDFELAIIQQKHPAGKLQMFTLSLKGIKYMWIILFALPALCVNESIGDENIAIVPHDDSRVMEIVK